MMIPLPECTPASWSAAEDGFPDQYQLDHILEVEATMLGHEQGDRDGPRRATVTFS